MRRIKKFYTGKNDTVFKAIVCNNDDKRILLAILKTILHRDFDDVKILNSELLKRNVFVKSKTVDLLLKDKDMTIIVELNANASNYSPERNFAYLASEIANKTKVGEDYKEDYHFIQINLTYELKDSMDFRIYNIQDKNGKKYIENVSIFEYNMSRLRKYYEENNQTKVEEYKYLIMLDMNIEELKNIDEGNEVILDYKDKLEEINNDPEYIPFLTVEEDNEKFINTIKKRATKAGLEEGMEKGMKKGIKESIEKISKELNIPKEQLKEIIDKN